MIARVALSLTWLVAACSNKQPAPTAGDDDNTPPDADTDGGDARTAPELGEGHGVDLVVIAQAPALDTPMDLKFDPVTGNLWIVDQADNGWTILRRAGSGFATPLRYHDHENHFLLRPSSLS